MTIRDGRDDVYDSGGDLKKIVTIVTDRHGHLVARKDVTLLTERMPALSGV